MADKESSITLGIEEILTEAAEIQLATFNAGIEFWSMWVEQTTRLSKAMETHLNTFKKNPDKQADVFLEITESNREYLREMTGLPKNVAKKFIDEVDRLQKKRTPVKEKAPATPKRRARVKP